MTGERICSFRPFVSSIVPSAETTARDVEILKGEIEGYLRDMRNAVCFDFIALRFVETSSPVVVSTVTLDVPSVGSNGSFTTDLTVAGLALGTHVISWAPLTDATSLDDMVIQFLVVAEDTLRFTAINPSGGSINPATITFQFVTATLENT